MPVATAFSYLVKPGGYPTAALKCERTQVVPGETVTVVGTTQHTLRVPSDALPDTHLWQQFEGQWIDFRAVPLVDASLHLDDVCAGPSTLDSLSDRESGRTRRWMRTKTNQGESDNRVHDCRDVRAGL
jgi:hypothetical protein